MANKYIKKLLMFVFIALLIFGMIIGLAECVRVHNSLFEINNVDTKRASFSLTTTPLRIEHMEPTIKSLLAQGPKTVYLNVPYKFNKTGEDYVIPSWLNKYIETGQVTLIRLTDKGPATKFMGLFEYEKGIDPEEYICVVDDDHVYNKNLLSNLINKADQFNGTRVISTLLPLGPPRIEGWCGFIFKWKLLWGIRTYPTPKECFLVDDPWITNYFLDNGIKLTRLFKIQINNISVTETPKNVFEFLNNVFSIRLGYNLEGALFKDRNPDENLNCVKALHVDNPIKIIENDIAVIKTINN